MASFLSRVLRRSRKEVPPDDVRFLIEACVDNRFLPNEGGFIMKPREDERRAQKTPQIRGAAPKPKLQIVKLEERIAPRTPGGGGGCDEFGCGTNHNETLVRDRA